MKMWRISNSASWGTEASGLISWNLVWVWFESGTTVQLRLRPLIIVLLARINLHLGQRHPLSSKKATRWCQKPQATFNPRWRPQVLPFLNDFSSSYPSVCTIITGITIWSNELRLMSRESGQPTATEQVVWELVHPTPPHSTIHSWCNNMKIQTSFWILSIPIQQVSSVGWSRMAVIMTRGRHVTNFWA